LSNFQLICGLEEGLSEAASRGILSWYEFLVLRLNYVRPLTRPSGLLPLATSTLAELGLSTSTLEARDAILLAAMAGDPLGLLRELSAVWDSPWVGLHLADLIVAAGTTATSTVVTSNSPTDQLTNNSSSRVDYRLV
jgi:hypothetical protein